MGKSVRNGTNDASVVFLHAYRGIIVKKQTNEKGERMMAKVPKPREAGNASGVVKTYIVPHPPLIIPEIGKGEEKKIQKHD